MRFLSDILAKAGLIVDGAAVFNSSATGQTPASNDNSTKFATTAWVRTFVQPYTLPIASASVLGGIKVGTGLAIDAVTGVLSVSGGAITLKSSQTFTATAGQTVFTIAGGYTPGLIDVFLNGVYLSPGQTTATNGTTITLLDAALADDIIDVIVTSPIGEGSIATTDSLAEGVTNLYYTPARARTAISLTTTGVSGVATYNNLTGVFNIPNYQGLVPANGTAGQILAKIDGTSYNTTWIDNFTSQIKHQVKLGENMSAGTPVYVPISQDSGTVMTVMKASNAGESTSSKTMGLTMTSGVTGDLVDVITEGLLSGLNTSTASKGDPVWLGTNGALIFGLTNKPVAPAHLVFLGIVTRSQSNNGEIFVKVQNGFELDELHDVSITSKANNEGLFYESSTNLWKNKTIAAVLGYTPVTAARTITINGTTYDLSADRSWTIASGVTSFNTRTGAITLTSGDVTGALGYTPYNSTNPSGYITSSALSSYLPLIGGTLTGALIGTSATFKGIGVFNNSGSGDANSGIRIVAPISTTHYNWMIGAQQNINAGFEITPSTTIGGTTFSIPALSILNTGAATFSSSVTASSFSGAATGLTGTASSLNIGGSAGSLGGVTTAQIVYGDNSTKTSTFSNADDYLPSGHWNAYGASNMPYSSWFHLITNRHTNTANNYQLQIAGEFWTNDVYTRKVTGASGSSTTWTRLLNALTDPYAVSMDQYVRTSDSVVFGGIRTGGSYTGYHASFKPTTNATFNIGQSTGNIGVVGPFLNATRNGISDTTSAPMFFNADTFNWFCNYDQKMKLESQYGDLFLRGYIYQGNTNWSDLRMKQNLKQITDPLTKIQALNGYTFEWREWTGYRNTPEVVERINDAGLIAQEVETVFPDIVELDKKRDQYSLNYNGVIALHTEGIKELIAQNQALQARITELEARL